MTDIFDSVKKMASLGRNPYLDAAVAGGSKVIGYFCSYVPEEIIHAAGMIPYRMRAVDNRGTDRGSVYYSAINCSFVRSCFGKALEGDFSFLDGIVFSNGCDHLRRMYDNWRYAGTGPRFRHMLWRPGYGRHCVTRFADELRVRKIYRKYFRGWCRCPEGLISRTTKEGSWPVVRIEGQGRSEASFCRHARGNLKPAGDAIN